MLETEQMPQEKPRLLNEQEAALIINFSVHWLRKARYEGTGPPYRKLGKAVRYPEDWLVRWVEQHPLRSAMDATTV